jgi:hypothetical protein
MTKLDAALLKLEGALNETADPKVRTLIDEAQQDMSQILQITATLFSRHKYQPVFVGFWVVQSTWLIFRSISFVPAIVFFIYYAESSSYRLNLGNTVNVGATF